MKLIVTLLLFLAASAQAAAPAALLNAERQRKAVPLTAERIWEEVGQRGKVEHVKADNPSPLLSGIVNGECQLLVNDAAPVRLTGIGLIVGVTHEAGHCVAHSIGFTKAGEISRSAEAFADVYAIAWISKNRPDQLDEAFSYLMTLRKTTRLTAPVYDTLIPLNRARQLLPTDDPVAFTRDLLK